MLSTIINNHFAPVWHLKLNCLSSRTVQCRGTLWGTAWAVPLFEETHFTIYIRWLIRPCQNVNLQETYLPLYLYVKLRTGIVIIMQENQISTYRSPFLPSKWRLLEQLLVVMFCQVATVISNPWYQATNQTKFISE